MATKTTICPTCNLPWPNFCPKDGTPLQGAWTCPNAVRPGEKAQAAGGHQDSTQEIPLGTPKKPHGGGMAEKDDADKTVLLTPAVPASAALDWLESKKKAPKKDEAPVSPDEAKTVLHMPAVEAPKKKGGGLMSEGALEKIAAKVKAEMDAQKEAPSKPGTPKAAPAAEAKGGKKPEKKAQEFSETQWFMKGVQVDADLLEIVDESEYERDENISEAQRKGFTLRKDDEKKK